MRSQTVEKVLRRIVWERSPNDESDLSEQLERTVLKVNSKSNNYITEVIQIEQSKSSFIIDTGSPINIISSKTLKNVSPNCKVFASNQILSGLSGHQFTTKGHVCLSSTYGKNCCQLTYHIIKNGPDIIGLEGIQALNINLNSILSPISKTIYAVNKDLDIISKLVEELSNNVGGLKIKPVKLAFNFVKMCIVQPL